MRKFGWIALAALTLAAPAFAEVKQAAPDGMVLEFKGEMPLARAEAWKRVLTVSSWWSDGHTYSGKASNLSLDAEAGGCWCEIWPGGQVEHARVIYLANNNAVRFSAPLGPLQGMGVNAVLGIQLADGKAAGSTSVTMTMNVVGSSLSGLDKFAAGVDGVLKEAFGKLVAGK